MKFLATTLALILLVGFVGFASTDIGFIQDTQQTKFRFDYKNFLFEIPIKDTINEFSVGGKVPVDLGNSYGIVKLNLKGKNLMDFDSMGFGLGYPIKVANFKIRGEMFVSAPKWQEFKTWRFTPSIGIQFSLNDLQKAVL